MSLDVLEVLELLENQFFWIQYGYDIMDENYITVHAYGSLYMDSSKNKHKHQVS